MVDFKNMHCFLKGCIWITLLLTLFTWMVWTAGLSSLQYNCARFSNLYFVNGIAVVPGQPAVGGCMHIYQLWWWVWAFEFAVLLALIFVLVAGHLRSTRVMFTGLLATLSVLTMFGSNTFYYEHFGTTGYYLDRVRVTDAGFIMTAAMNMLLMIFVALDPMPKHHDSQVSDVAFNDPKPSTRTTTTDPTTATTTTPLRTTTHGDNIV